MTAEDVAAVPQKRAGGVLGAAVASAIGALMMLMGFASLFMAGPYRMPGIVLLLAGALCLPPVGRLLRGRGIPSWSRFIAAFCLIGVWASMLPKVEGTATSEQVAGAASPEQQEQVAANLPEAQRRFDEIIAASRQQYSAGGNDLQRSAARLDRDQKITQLMAAGAFTNWEGTLEQLTTNGDGNAVISVKLDGCQCSIKTWNNAVSDAIDHTMIPGRSALFNELASMKEGAHVKITGFLVMDEGKPRESSLTEKGSVEEPEFVARFAAVTR